MKFIKNNIKILIIIIITAILFSGLSIYATYTYLAKDIIYIPDNSNFKVNNVEDALNELYESVKTNISGLDTSKLLYTSTSHNGSYTFDGTHSKALVFLWGASRDNNVLVNYSINGGKIIFDRTISTYMDTYTKGRIIIIDNITQGIRFTHSMRWQPGIFIYGI